MHFLNAVAIFVMTSEVQQIYFLYLNQQVVGDCYSGFFINWPPPLIPTGYLTSNIQFPG
jgi:hypothetical protein